MAVASVDQPPATLKPCSVCGGPIPWSRRRAAAYARRERCGSCGRGRGRARGRRRLPGGRLNQYPLGKPKPRPAALRHYSLARVPAVYRRPYTLEVWLARLHAQVRVPISSLAQQRDFVRAWQAGEYGDAMILLAWRYSPLIPKGVAA